MEKQSPLSHGFWNSWKLAENNIFLLFLKYESWWKWAKLDVNVCTSFWNVTSEAKDRPWPTVNFFDLLAKDQII